VHGDDAAYVTTLCIGFGACFGRENDYEGGKYAEIWRQFP